jgi:hypothetical protein
MRVIYNHVAKAAGTYLINVIRVLTKQNGFRLLTPRSTGVEFYASEPELRAMIDAQPDDSVVTNHAGIVAGNGYYVSPQFAWINIVREPIARAESIYYYEISPERGQSGLAAMRVRRMHGACGCADIEFDACVRRMRELSCTFAPRDLDAKGEPRPGTPASWLARQTTYFQVPGCPHGAAIHVANCTLAAAADNMRRFRLVGLSEEMALTLRALEKLLPRFFANATTFARSIGRSGRHETSLENNVAGLSMKGAVSSLARRILASSWPAYAEEEAFYEEAKHAFWAEVARLGLLQSRATSRSRRWPAALKRKDRVLGGGEGRSSGGARRNRTKGNA